MPEQKTYYRKVRDLGAVFSAAFLYLRQNFKTFFGSILLFAGPFLLIGTIISSYMLRSVFNIASIGSAYGYRFKELFFAYAIFGVIMSIGSSIFTVVLNKNIIDNEKLPENEPLTLKQVGSNFFNDYWRVLGNMLLLGITTMAVLAVVVLVFASLFSVFAGGGAGIGFFIVILVLLLLAFLFIFMPFICFIPLTAMFVCQRDRITIFAAIGKVLHYIKNNFWSTWAVCFVALLSYSVMAMFAQIPVYIITLVTAFSRVRSTVGYGVGEGSTPILLVAVTSLCSLLSHLVLSIYYLMNIYQYTNLEEKKEGLSILEKINQIQ